MEYFTIQELTVTSVKENNTPMLSEKENLITLVNNVLDPLRELYGKPIHINSGYRSPIVNRKIGGSSTSQHVKGMAVDITGGSKEENEILFNLIVDNFKFDQLINENDFQWVHVSFNKNKNRNQKLKFEDGHYINI